MSDKDMLRDYPYKQQESGRMGKLQKNNHFKNYLMTQDQEKLTRIYEAFNRRDIPEVLSLMHEDVLWPNGWEGGYVTGQQEVRDYWLRQWKEVDPVVVPVAFKEGNDGKIITVVHQVVKDKEGKLLFDGNILHVYELKDGLISNMEIQEYIPS